MENYKKILINFMLYILFFIGVCLVGMTNVFALTYDNNVGYQTDITVLMVSTDYADSPINVPVGSGYALAEVREVIIQVNNYNFSANTNYQLELYLPEQDLGRANYYSVIGANNESCVTSYDNSSFEGSYPRWAFQCSSPTNNITIYIKNSSNLYLWDYGSNGAPVFTWSYSYLRTSSTSLSENGLASDVIINNQNQNTQDIIDNQNANVDKQIESQKVCSKKIINKDSIENDNNFLRENGNLFNSNNWGITDYLEIFNYIKVISGTSGDTFRNTYFCFYDENKTLINCYHNYNLNVGNVTIPNNAKFVRFSLNKTQDKPQFQMDFCTNGNQVINDSINDLNSSLTDSSSINIDSLGDTAGWLPPGPIDSIINLPLTFLNNLLNALNSTCAPLSVPLPYVNQTVSIPCISTIFNNISGLPSFWNWVGIITSVMILYKYLLGLYKYYDDLTTLKANFISDFGGVP